MSSPVERLRRGLSNLLGTTSQLAPESPVKEPEPAPVLQAVPIPTDTVASKDREKDPQSSEVLPHPRGNAAAGEPECLEAVQMSDPPRPVRDCGNQARSAFPPGRGSQLTPAERREIQELALVQGCSQSEISRRVHRDRGTIANVIHADDTQELARQLQSEQRQAALDVLRRSVVPAAQAWATAAAHAAEKGDHRPARDLLLHTNVIEPLADSHPTARVMVIIGTPEQPIPDDPLARARPVSGASNVPVIVGSGPLPMTEGKDNAR